MSNVIVNTQTNKNIVVTTAGDVINVTLRNGVPMPFPTPGLQGEKGDKGDQGNPTTVNGKTGESITLDKNDIGLGNVDNTADVDKPLSTAMQAALSGKAALVHTHAISDVTGLQTALDAKQGAIAYTPEDAALKQNDLTSPDSTHYPTTQAVAGALATKADLVNGKVPLTQINDALIGNVHYKGLYSFTTGVITSDDVTLNGQPLPAAATANVGWYFIAQDSGTVDGTSFILGDWLISNGALGWHKVDNTDAVSSVNGYTGNVLLTKADVGLGNVPNTDATNPANTVQTASYRFVTDTEKATWNSKQASATTLSGYGITDAVDLYNPQTISGIKTWASGANSIAIGPNKMYVQITDSIYINTAGDIRLNCLTLYLNGNNGILSNQSISFSAGKGLSFVNSAGGYTDLLPSASPVAAGYTVRMPNASGTIALVGDIPTTAAWSTITGTPTTLGGYGITDAYPLSSNPAGYLTAIPDLSGTYDTLSTNQTITGLKTFSNGIVNTSASTGLTHYNTSDQVINPEYVQMYWTANRFFIQANKSGTGTLRTVYLISNSRSLSVSPAVSSIGAINAEGSTNAIGGAIFGITGSFTNTTNNGNGISILPTINQSGSAGYSAIYAAPYEQAIGSGNRYLINLGTQSAANDSGSFTARLQVAANGSTYLNGALGIGTPATLSGLTVSRTISGAAWGTVGINMAVLGTIATDNTSSGTVATVTTATSFGIPTFAASNATTYTTAANVYIAGPPSAGTNVTITNPYALYVASGNTLFASGTSVVFSTTVWGSANSSGNANFLAAGGRVSISATDSKALFAGASTVYFRALLNGDNATAGAIADSSSYSNLIIGSSPIITSATGTHSLLANVVINPIGTVTLSGATVTSTASLYIGGAGSGGTNNFSLYIAGGTSVFSGPVTIGGITTGQQSWLKVGTSKSAAYWGNTGIALATATSQTYTDTSSSGTVSSIVLNNIGAATIAASSTTTYTNANTLYIDAAPSAGTNVTITNTNAIFVAAGTSVFNGGIATSQGTGIGTGSNFVAAGGINTVSTSTSTLMFGGSSTVTGRVTMAGNGSSTLTAGVSYSNLIVGSTPITTAATGTHNILASLVINPLGTVTSSGSSITNTATLYIDGVSSAGTNNYAIWVNSGTTYLNGALYANGIMSSAAGGSSSNFYVSNSVGNTVTSAGGSIFFSSSSVYYRTSLGSNQTGTAVGANFSYANTIISSAPILSAATGTHGMFANLVVNSIGTVTSGGASVTNTASLYINGAGSGGTNNYSLYVNGGNSVFTGRLALGSLAAGMFGIVFSPTLNPWGTTGAMFSVASSTTTDASTSASGTVSTTTVFNSFGTPTLAATNTGVTYSGAVANLYIAGAPVAGTNVTISGTNTWAFYVNSGNTYLGGTCTLVGNGTIQGNARLSISAGITGANTTTTGVHLAVSTNTYIDNSTAASGTATWAVTSSFGGGIFAASNTGVTYTNAATVTIQGAPTAGANATIINAWSLYVAQNNVYFGNSSTSVTINRITGANQSYTTGVIGTTGNLFSMSASTITDSVTAASGTVATYAVSSFLAPTLAATNTSVTYTNAATLYIDAGPVSGTNVTVTNRFALYVAAGNSFFGGTISTSSNITASTGITSNRAAIAATSTDGLIIQNNTSATSGAQIQYSPRLRFTGQAWNTTSLASHNATFLQEVQTAAGNPITANLVFSSQINAGTVNAITTLSDTGTLTTVQHGWKSLSTDPATSNIAAGTYQVYKNTTTGTIKLWVNDGGTLKSVTLT